MDDKVMIHNLRQDHDNGYRMMIHKYSSYVGAIVYRMTSELISTSEMEELIADVFFRIWEKRAQLTGDSLKGLLAQTARNLCIDQFRKHKQIFLPLDEDILQRSNKDNTHQIWETKEQMEIVSSAVSVFEEPDKEIFLRFYYFGESLKTIAELLQLNLSTVKTKLRRSREKLKEKLSERGYRYE